jgi:hypothetical protein
MAPMPVHRIGLLYRGDRRADRGSERADAMLGPLYDTFAALGVTAEHIVYSDDAVEEVKNQLLDLDGVLVWVNPIEDGANRAQLDSLLRDASTRGVWVSAHPDAIGKMGTKEVLFYTRALGWGTDTDLYRSPQELAERFPPRLARAGQLVVKQARGNGGDGVWRVALVGDRSNVDEYLPLDTVVRIQHAVTRDVTSEDTTLGAFLERCNDYFGWSGSLISQPYQPRLRDGMIRCYFVQDKVVGFCHQWPLGLLDSSPPGQQSGSGRSSRGPWEDAETPHYRRLRTRAEAEWVPSMKDMLGLDANSMPVIWDADFLHGPKSASGDDAHVLCEINVSCVWPYPPTAARPMAEAAIARVQAAVALRS